MENNIGNRINQVIEAIGIKKVKFAERLKIDQSYVTQLTRGKRNPSDRLLADICREFNVSEAWLRTGEGEMFVRREQPPLEALLVKLLGEQNVTEGDRVLMKNFLELSDASRREVVAFVHRMAELERQNQEKDKQLQDLAAKVAAMEEEYAVCLMDESSTSPSASAGSLSPLEKAKK